MQHGLHPQAPEKIGHFGIGFPVQVDNITPIEPDIFPLGITQVVCLEPLRITLAQQAVHRRIDGGIQLNVALVDEVDGDQRRIIFPGQSGVRIDMCQEIPGKCLPVLQRRRRGEHQLLELIHLHRPVGKLFDLPFFERTADEEIQRHVDALRFRLGEYAIHPVHFCRINLGGHGAILPDQIPLKVMESQQIVAAFPHAPRQRLRLLAGDEISIVAEISPIESNRFARFFFESKMAVDIPDGSVFSGGSVEVTGEIQRRTGQCLSGKIQNCPVLVLHQIGWSFHLG